MAKPFSTEVEKKKKQNKILYPVGIDVPWWGHMCDYFLL